MSQKDNNPSGPADKWLAVILNFIPFVQCNWVVEYRPKGWSVGYCSSCQQEGAVRLEHVLEVLYFYSIFPLHEQRTGEIARCDFCHRHVEQVRDWEGIPREDWSPEVGLEALLARLGMLYSVDLPEPSPDVRLHSLLTSVQRARSPTRVKLGPVGVFGGMTAAVIVAIPLAMWLHRNQIGRNIGDEFQFTFLMVGVSIFLGAILGATIEFLLKRDRSAVARIETAYLKYGIDLDRLEELAQTYGRQIRKAVKVVYQRAARGTIVPRAARCERGSPKGGL